MQDAPIILTRLRAETRPYHDAVEQNPFNQALSAGAATPEATAWFLSKLYGFVQPFEAALQRHAAGFGPAWALAQRYRAPLILEDLARLPGDKAVPPLCPAMPPLDTRPQLLGALYVLEGSTLGGQVIARQLAQAGIPLTTYFGARGSQTGPLWKQFCQLLAAEAEAASPAEQDLIVHSASLTFQRLSAWIQTH